MIEMLKVKSMKWAFQWYFIASTLLVIGTIYVTWLYFPHMFAVTEFLIGFILFLILISMVVGYIAGQQFQRKVDILHLSFLQLAKGNLSVRIPLDKNEPFHQIYQDFNEFTASLEERMKVLQSLGEENVLQKKTHEAAVLEERKRLARDLHDSVSQQLFAIHMAASAMSKIMDTDPDKARNTLEHLIQMSYLAQKQMRGFIAQLRPLELEGKSLEEALDEWFPEFCIQNELQGKLDVQLKHQLSEAKEHQLFLIIQEAIANVVKHASARHVTLSLHEMQSQYMLSISDDGQGFDPQQVKPGSYGLSTMQERAMKLGGEVEIWSKRGSGTRVTVRIPKFDASMDTKGEKTNGAEH